MLEIPDKSWTRHENAPSRGRQALVCVCIPVPHAPGPSQTEAKPLLGGPRWRPLEGRSSLTSAKPTGPARRANVFF